MTRKNGVDRILFAYFNVTQNANTQIRRKIDSPTYYIGGSLSFGRYLKVLIADINIMRSYLVEG